MSSDLLAEAEALLNSLPKKSTAAKTASSNAPLAPTSPTPKASANKRAELDALANEGGRRLFCVLFACCHFYLLFVVVAGLIRFRFFLTVARALDLVCFHARVLRNDSMTADDLLALFAKPKAAATSAAAPSAARTAAARECNAVFLLLGGCF